MRALRMPLLTFDMRYIFGFAILILIAIYCASGHSEQIYTNDDIKAMMNEPETSHQGMHQETRFDVPKSYEKPQFEVESWVGNEQGGYYEVNEDGTVDTSQLKESNLNSLNGLVEVRSSWSLVK